MTKKFPVKKVRKNRARTNFKTLIFRWNFFQTARKVRKPIEIYLLFSNIPGFKNFFLASPVDAPYDGTLSTENGTLTSHEKLR